MDASAHRRALKKTVGPALASLVLGLTLIACDGQGASESPSGGSRSASPTHDMEGMSEEEMSGEDHEGHASAGHDSAHSSAALAAALVPVGALPDGYRKGEGHLHADPDAAAPRMSASCSAIAELIGTHPSVYQSEHPQARATFSKGHFGPLVTETVIDYGDPSTARQAVDRLEEAARTCERYVQSTSPIGANTYTVEPSVPGWKGPEGTTLRLAATSRDFDGLNWDLWVTREDNRLLAVSLRSVAGGGNVDLAPSIHAARAALAES